MSIRKSLEITVLCVAMGIVLVLAITMLTRPMTYSAILDIIGVGGMVGVALRVGVQVYYSVRDMPYSDR